MLIEPSEEIKAVVRRFNQAMIDRDQEAVRNLLSRFDGLRFIGTDPAEWWKGHALVSALLSRQIDEMPDVTSWTIEDDEAYQCGQAGWSSGWFRADFSDGSSYVARMTAVLVLETGQWRIVQWHVSEGVANEYALTTTIEQLVGAIGDRDLAALDQHVPSGPVTVVFTDLEGSTELAARMGDSRWYSLLQWHDKAIADLAVMHKGAVVKTLGDGAMLAFGTAPEAVRCACDIQRLVADPSKSALRIRIGIHSGESIRHGSDLLGTTVNKAARVAAVASGGEIVVSEDVKEAIDGDPIFVFGPALPVVLRGLEGSHIVHTVGLREGALPGPA